MTEAYFATDDGIWFRGTPYTRGPWDVDACHAGPPTGLVVRAMERAVPTKRLVRVMVEISRPIPLVGFRVEVEVVREGRSAAQTIGHILDDERVHATVRGMHHRTIELETVTAPYEVPRLEDSIPGGFPIHTTTHGEQAISSSVEMRYDPSASIGDGGPTVAWMKSTMPLLVDEEPSGFQRICALADSGNGISYNEYLDRVRFVNTDLLLSIHREPEGDWLGSRVLSHWHSSGIGMADAALFDVHGPVGRATQNLLLDPT